MHVTHARTCPQHTPQHRDLFKKAGSPNVLMWNHYHTIIVLNCLLLSLVVSGFLLIEMLQQWYFDPLCRYNCYPSKSHLVGGWSKFWIQLHSRKAEPIYTSVKYREVSISPHRARTGRQPAFANIE